MERLNKADWKVINAALALYEATPLDGEVDDEDEHYAQVERTRVKVWAHLST